MLSEIRDQVIGQFLAIAAFFAYPAFQYVTLKIFSRRGGEPELWYLPDFGFRLVIRNLPHKRTLTDIRSQVFRRHVIHGTPGSSAATLIDDEILKRETMVLFPGTDQILLSFKLADPGPDTTGVRLQITDKLGSVMSEMVIEPEDRLISDYVATIQNPLNFDILMGKRIEIHGSSLRKILTEIRASGAERQFSIDRIRNIQ
jgi:hypothetical protein